MDTWTLERTGPIAIARFANPPRNSMRFADMTALEAIVTEVALDESVTVLVLASDVPGYFVLHGDLEDLIRLGEGEPVRGDPASWPRVLALFEAMPQVVVAAINGQAWGGGLEMTLACTLRVAGPAASLGLPEVGLGLIPGGGGTQRLPRLIGAGNAACMILSGIPVEAGDALRLGLVQAVLPGKRFLDGVLEWLQPITSRPGYSLRAAKRAIVEGQHLPLDRGLAVEAELAGALLATPETISLQRAVVARYASTDPRETVAI